MVYLGIDIGTSTICGVVYHPTTNKIESVTKTNSAGIESDNQWESLQDPEKIVNIVFGLVNEVKSRGDDIAGIGLCGQMHGILYVNAQGYSVSPLYTWQDRRGDKIYKDGLSYASFLSNRSGYKLYAGYGLVTHFYHLVHHEIPPTAHRLCTMMDYVGMRLCGRNDALIDASNAASLGFFSLDRLAFDNRALENVGISPSMLPDVAPSGAFWDNGNDMRVCTAIGDNQAAFLGAVADKEHAVHLSVGTSSQLSIYSHDFIEVPDLETRPLPGGGYIIVGAALCGGAAFTVLQQLYNEILERYAGIKIPSETLYDQMTSIAFRASHADDILVKTLFDGTRIDPEGRGSIQNISMKNLTNEHLILGFLRGISSELLDYYQKIPSYLSKNKTMLVGSGNGIRKNALLRTILEHDFGRPIVASDSNEEAAYGACLYAMSVLNGKV